MTDDRVEDALQDRAYCERVFQAMLGTDTARVVLRPAHSLNVVVKVAINYETERKLLQRLLVVENVKPNPDLDELLRVIEFIQSEWASGYELFQKKSIPDLAANWSAPTARELQFSWYTGWSG